MINNFLSNLINSFHYNLGLRRVVVLASLIETELNYNSSCVFVDFLYTYNLDVLL